MRFNTVTQSSLLAGAVLMALWMVVVVLSARNADADTKAPRPYAETRWIKLGKVMPTDAGAPDVYVRLISVDGEVLPPEEEKKDSVLDYRGPPACGGMVK